MKETDKNKLTQKDWEETDGLRSQLQKKEPSEEPIDFGAFLEAHGFSRHIEDVSFCQFNFYNFSLIRLEFHECNFAGCDFRNTSLLHSRLTKCNFTRTKWLEATWNNVSLNACNFFHAEMLHSTFKTVSIKNSMLSGSYWSHAQLVELQIYNSVLNESVFYSTFIHNSSMFHTELKDALWIQNRGDFLQTNCQITSTNRPIVGMAWDFLQRGTFSPYIDEALRDNGAIVLKIEMQPKTVDAIQLGKEVVRSLNSRIESDFPTIAEKFFCEISQKPEIDRILVNARSLLDYCDAVVLPGGDDIEPEMYCCVTEFSEQRDYRRSITEVSLLAHADKQKIPVMGICRGSQMINVYFGGTLRELPVAEKYWQHLVLSDSSKKNELQQWINGDFIPAFSMHHQASDKIGENLEIIIEREGIPKLIMTYDGQFIGIQFHPEAYLIIDSLHGPPEAIRNKGIYQFFFSKILQYQMQSV